MEKARTQRTLVCGTAKRLGEKHAKPRPVGRVLWAVLSFKFAVFRRDRSRSYAKFFVSIYMFGRILLFANQGKKIFAGLTAENGVSKSIFWRRGGGVAPQFATALRGRTGGMGSSPCRLPKHRLFPPMNAAKQVFETLASNRIIPMANNHQN